MLIDVRDVTHGFDGRPPVLRDLTVRLDEHRIGVIGANGSGKSTFARMLNGLVVPEHGTVTLDGLDTTRQGKQVRRRVGFCFTDPDSQIVMPTVAEDVAFGLRRRGLSRAEIADQLDLQPVERMRAGEFDARRVERVREAGAESLGRRFVGERDHALLERGRQRDGMRRVAGRG